jgi:hypothetical protein
MKTCLNPAFRSHAFVSNVTENIWPGGASRLHRNLVRRGRQVSYEQLGTDPWQLNSGMWFATEAELLEAQKPVCINGLGLGPDDGLPF